MERRKRPHDDAKPYRILAEKRNFSTILTTACITDTELHRTASREIQRLLPHLPNIDAKVIILWCTQYFNKFGRAPGSDISTIFESRREELIPAVEDTVQKFLEGISHKYAELPGFRGELQTELVSKELATVRLDVQLAEGRKLLKDGRLDEARRLVKALQTEPAEATGDLLHVLLDCQVTSTEFLQAEITPPRPILEPWLTAGSLSMIHGERGVGKTWLTHILASAVTRQNWTDVALGGWSVRKPTGVLLVDGEMPRYWLQLRLRQLAATMGEEDDRYPLHLISSGELAEKRKDLTINLYNADWQQAVYNRMALNIKRQRILWLDNLGSLFWGKDYNLQLDWDGVNRWFVSLRNLGAAVVLVHHPGKSGLQLGTSVRENPLDNIIKLTKPKGWTPADKAWFAVQFEKSRNLGPKADTSPFTVRVVEHASGQSVRWEMQKVKDDESADRLTAIRALLVDGNMKQNRIAALLDCKPAYVTQQVKPMQAKNHLDNGKHPTKAGLEWRQTVDLEEVLARLGVTLDGMEEDSLAAKN